jgi:hypothetical protein
MLSKHHAACALLPLLLACSGSDDTGDSAASVGAGGSAPAQCGPTEALQDGQCVDPVAYLEPAERVDADNVVDYSGETLTLDLPDPPKSGFRLVVPPRTLGPAEELNTCVAWAYPEITHHKVYAARIYTNGMLHHSNMYGMPLSDQGPSDYPSCAPGQTDLVAQVPNWLEGNILDVLFANSTQIRGGESVVFPEGMAFNVTTEGREVATSIHWLNTSAEEFVSEVVYDFYTMPDDMVQEELVPFVFDNQAFSVPPQQISDVSTTCDITPVGNIVTLMPHNHERVSKFVVDLLDTDGNAEQIFEADGFDTASDIHVYDEPISLDGSARIRHTCTVNNDLDQDIVWGIGQNEMCTLFGYLYPPAGQQLGIVMNGATECTSLYIGQYRK